MPVAWEQRPLEAQPAQPTIPEAEVALIIPHQAWVTLEWAVAFKDLQLPTYRRYFNKGYPWDVARETMTRGALKDGCKYLFYLDSDVICNDPQTFLKLKAVMDERNQGIVSGLYYAKKDPPIPAAWIFGPSEGRNISFNIIEPAKMKEYTANNNLLEVSVVGLGCCLVRRDVFEKLDQKFPGRPYFRWGCEHTDEELMMYDNFRTSEDFNFVIQCDRVGFRPQLACGLVCDHAVDGKHNRMDGHLEHLGV
jgi:hypothetical protein